MIEELLAQYAKAYPAEAAKLQPILEQLAAGKVMNDRQTVPGHVTGSAYVLSPDRRKLLLIFHKYLERWMQAGGHWEADEPTPLAAARREAEEETAVQLAKQLSIETVSDETPFDIDIQLIPANPVKDEPEHYHYDFRYVFLAASETLDLAAAEYDQVQWFAIAEAESLGRVGMKRVIAKLRSAQLI